MHYISVNIDYLMISYDIYILFRDKGVLRATTIDPLSSGFGRYNAAPLSG